MNRSQKAQPVDERSMALKKRMLPARWFDLRGQLKSGEKKMFTLLGTVVLFIAWQLIVMITNTPKAVFPSPLDVLTAFPVLHFEQALVRETLYSMYLNYGGMFSAALFAIPLGFYIGLQPIARAMTEKQLAVFRYAPLMVLIGVFIALFENEDLMKIQFLAAGIFVYLLPTTIARVDQTRKVYLDTAYTCNASRSQLIWTVYYPSVREQIIQDIKILSPISWTYITIAEMLSYTPGALNGIGRMAYYAGRFGEPDKAIACLLVIFMVAWITDKCFDGLDWLINRHKYVGRAH